MSNEIVKHIQPLVMTQDQLDLITKTIAKNATPDELKLFIYRAQNMGLDPLKPGQIHFVKYGNSPGTIVIGIEGFRTIAGRSGKHTGTQRGILRDEKGKAIAGWAEVYRSDWPKPARLEVSMAEYNKGSGPWKTMPESMIQKVAEAGALRMAFPDDLGGVYSQEEMDQAKNDGGIHPEQPDDNTLVECGSNDPGEDPIFTRGSFAKRYPREIDVEALRKWVGVVEKRLSNPKKPIDEKERKEWEWNIEIATKYLGDLETSFANFSKD